MLSRNRSWSEPFEPTSLTEQHSEGQPPVRPGTEVKRPGNRLVVDIVGRAKCQLYLEHRDHPKARPKSERHLVQGLDRQDVDSEPLEQLRIRYRNR